MIISGKTTCKHSSSDILQTLNKEKYNTQKVG